MAVFVTGATGFLGRYLVQGLLDEGEEVVLLIRGDDAVHAHTRAREALAWFESGHDALVGDRVAVCAGDLDRPGLGLSEDDRGFVLERCDSFLHCGASVRFDMPIERARAINVEGTRALLDLAAERQRRDSLRRIDHVSTTYVAGRRRDLVGEDELDCHAEHRNSYERTKWEAERMLRERRRDLPIATLRPSIIVGESDLGRTSNFNVLYWPMKVYANGHWRTLPGRTDVPLDIVPVDFVRDAMLALRRRPDTIGGTFHVAAGAQGAISIGEVVALVERFFPERRGVRVVDPSLWIDRVHPLLKAVSFGRFRRLLEGLEIYFPYFLGNPIFDNARTAQLLAEEGIPVPTVTCYFERLLHYCLETDWGRRDRPKPAERTTQSEPLTARAF